MISSINSKKGNQCSQCGIEMKTSEKKQMGDDGGWNLNSNSGSGKEG